MWSTTLLGICQETEVNEIARPLDTRQEAALSAEARHRPTVPAELRNVAREAAEVLRVSVCAIEPHGCILLVTLQ
jgi:hypothetical protein